MTLQTTSSPIEEKKIRKMIIITIIIIIITNNHNNYNDDDNTTTTNNSNNFNSLLINRLMFTCSIALLPHLFQKGSCLFSPIMKETLKQISVAFKQAMEERWRFPSLEVTFTVFADERGVSLAIKPLAASMEDYLTTGVLCGALNSDNTVKK